MLRVIATARESSASLGVKHLVTNGMAWHPVCHTGVAQSGVGNQRWLS